MPWRAFLSELGLSPLTGKDPLWLSTEVGAGASHLAAVLVMAHWVPGPGGAGQGVWDGTNRLDAATRVEGVGRAG